MIDALLDRTYDRQGYNCLHFAGDAWASLTGDTRLKSVREDDFTAGKLAALFRGYQRQPGPTVAPSIVLMQTLAGDNHIGVCVRRRLLHLDESGAQFTLIDAVIAFYRNMRFYA